MVRSDDQHRTISIDDSVSRNVRGSQCDGSADDTGERCINWLPTSAMQESNTSKVKMQPRLWMPLKGWYEQKYTFRLIERRRQKYLDKSRGFERCSSPYLQVYPRTSRQLLNRMRYYSWDHQSTCRLERRLLSWKPLHGEASDGEAMVRGDDFANVMVSCDEGCFEAEEVLRDSFDVISDEDRWNFQAMKDSYELNAGCR